jgi:integrase
MGRQATGCAQWDKSKGMWVAWITLADKSRKPVPMAGLKLAPHAAGCPCRPKEPCDARRAAIVMASLMSKRARATGAVDVLSQETCDEYFGRWNDAREAFIVTTADERGRWKKWLSPHVGTKPIASVTKRDLELLVSALDKDVRLGKLAWKTAIHAWGTCTKLFDDAARGKDLTLRCLETNPARDVRGPDRGHDRASAFLFPAELLTLLSCETVPLGRRRLYALAVYLGCRAGELRALEWEDVHEGEGFVHVHRSHNIHSGKAKSTKTGITRRVPIEPELLPLLETMREESSGAGKVLAIGSAWELPRCLRADLKHAGVTRAELEADDATRRPIDFHDLRHTYGTWRAIRGDDIIKIRFAMGHTDLTTTQRYINEAHVFEGARFGTPFGPLPPSVFESLEKCQKLGIHERYQRPQRELNPCYRRERPVS